MEESYHWELKDYHTVTLKGIGLTNLDEDDLITIIKYVDD
jgi:hypothetical protein